MPAKGDIHPLSAIKKRYRMQRSNAKDRGIAFLQTFEEWYQIWLGSGHLHERGRKRYQYVMARFGDKGPYKIGNVKICTVAENATEKRFKLSKAARAKISKALTGKPRSPVSAETRLKRSISLRGNKNSLGHRHPKSTRLKMSLAHRQNRMDDETCRG